jgi:hypothetical protein
MPSRNGLSRDQAKRPSDIQSQSKTLRTRGSLVNPAEAPAFLVEKRALPRKKATVTGKTARKKGMALRVDGDTGTAEMKQRQRIVMEVRARSSTGHITSIGARVEAQIPIDRYKLRSELDPINAWRNIG